MGETQIRDTVTNLATIPPVANYYAKGFCLLEDWVV